MAIDPLGAIGVGFREAGVSGAAVREPRRGENDRMGENTTPAPVHQPMRALEHANRVRLARAGLKRHVATGAREAAEIVQSCPWEAEGMAISELLMSQPRWGRARCRRLLLSLGLVENKQLGSLTERQRTLLAAVLSSRPAAGERASRPTADRRRAPTPA